MTRGKIYANFPFSSSDCLMLERRGFFLSKVEIAWERTGERNKIGRGHFFFEKKKRFLREDKREVSAFFEQKERTAEGKTGENEGEEQKEKKLAFFL